MERGWTAAYVVMLGACFGQQLAIMGLAPVLLSELKAIAFGLVEVVKVGATKVVVESNFKSAIDLTLLLVVVHV